MITANNISTGIYQNDLPPPQRLERQCGLEMFTNMSESCYGWRRIFISKLLIFLMSTCDIITWKKCVGELLQDKQRRLKKHHRNALES